MGVGSTFKGFLTLFSSREQVESLGTQTENTLIDFQEGVKNHLNVESW